ncbi:MAG: CAP domain-containing protein [Pseudomonadota bacterium]
MLVSTATAAGGACAPAIVPAATGGPAMAGAATFGGGPSTWSPAAAQPLRPGGGAAAVYGALPAGASTGDVPRDALRSAIVDQTRRLARDARLPEPRADTRLDAVANDLARGLRGTELPPFEVVDFLLSHYGLVEASPNLLLARASPDADSEVKAQIGEQIAALLKSGHIAQVGVGIHRAAEQMSVVVALQEKNVDLAPIARSMAVGDVQVVAGALLGNHRRPEVIVTAPDGSTHELPIRGDAARTGFRAGFRADLRCDRGRGRYQVEVTGDDVMGTAVVANFPVFCGQAPPVESPRPALGPVGPMSAPAAEDRLLELVNRDRRAARLPPLAIDRKLSDVARGHSQDMADHDFVGHLSPRTGSALDRVRKAGIDPVLLLENVGRAYSPDETEAGLMQSPGHRANIMDGRVTRIGIGVVIGKQVTGTSPLLVTQLFM